MKEQEGIRSRSDWRLR